MRPVRAAITLLIILVLSVLANSYCISAVTDGLCEDIELAASNGCDAAEVEAAFQKFKRAEKFISLTVNHADLADAEDAFGELIAAAGDDAEAVRAAKSRLTDALRHLGRLSGINLESII